MPKKKDAGPEVPFPFALVVRYRDRLSRLPAVQREHMVQQAAKRVARGGSVSARDRVFAELATITKVGNG